MSEQLPNPGIPNIEAILKDHRAELLAAIEQQAPTPYTEADIEHEQYEADRMNGYNDGRESVLEIVRKILGI